MRPMARWRARLSICLASCSGPSLWRCGADSLPARQLAAVDAVQVQAEHRALEGLAGPLPWPVAGKALAEVPAADQSWPPGLFIRGFELARCFPAHDVQSVKDERSTDLKARLGLSVARDATLCPFRPRIWTIVQIGRRCCVNRQVSILQYLAGMFVISLRPVIRKTLYFLCTGCLSDKEA